MRQKQVDNSSERPAPLNPEISFAYHSWLGKHKTKKKIEAVTKTIKQASLIRCAKAQARKARKLEIINSLAIENLPTPDVKIPNKNP